LPERDSVHRGRHAVARVWLPRLTLVATSVFGCSSDVITGLVNPDPSSPGPSNPGPETPMGSITVTLLPSTLAIGVYESAQLTVLVQDATGGVLNNPSVTFSSSIAGVDENGLVTGLPGRCGHGTVVAEFRGVYSNPVHIIVGSESGAGCWDY
jgi:hypothetical protein